MTETSPRRHRDKTETSPNTETSPKPDRDKTETSPRQDRDMTETSPRQDRDILGEFFSGAWAAPGRLIHVRPQAYRYWGKTDSIHLPCPHLLSQTAHSNLPEFQMPKSRKGCSASNGTRSCKLTFELKKIG